MTRYWYAFGRGALVDALRIAGVAHGDRVLLPSFICRDVLAALSALGAAPEWYPVPGSLTITDSSHWPPARAVVAVNYFGFPQNLAPFREYAARTGAVLIEDNAHGWLSRDAEGRLLGERVSLGMTSVRKTVRSVDGAYLSIAADVVVDPALTLPGPNDVERRSIGAAMLVRRWVATIERGTRLPLMNVMRFVVRLMRRMAGRDAIPNDESLERRLPERHLMHRSSREIIDRVDVDAEVARRRTLYADIARRLADAPCTPIFPELPVGVSPQGYPLVARDDQLPAVRRALRGTGLEVTSWPDLPSSLHVVPDFYRRVRLVNFL